MATYAFPGQGSQICGMGQSLFPEFPDHVQKANNILGYFIDKLCLEDPNNDLNKTEYTQPALYIVNALTYLKKIKDTGQKPDYVIGHSLGEYNALFAAEVFDFETGLKLVQKRGELMAQAKDGGMAAVVGLTSDVVQKLLDENNLKDINIANYNSCTQVVISGPKENVNSTESIFLKAGAMLFMPLKVSGAFHSPYMLKAQETFSTFLEAYNFNSAKIPVISNVTALPYETNTYPSLLAKQITHSVLWRQSIEYLLNNGETVFEEIGPGKVLTGLITRIQKGQ